MRANAGQATSRIGRGHVEPKAKRGRAILAALLVTLCAPCLAAENGERRSSAGMAAAFGAPLGSTDTALPGILRLGLPGLRPSGTWSLAATFGYGMSEGPSQAFGAHQHVLGTVALGVTPLSGLDLSLRLLGRRDQHPADPQGPDSSYNGRPDMAVRYGKQMGAIAFGGELALVLPGRRAPSLALDAPIADAKLQLAHSGGPLTTAAMLGFRFDRSAKAQPDLSRTRQGDRMALGLSDFHAALLGMGLAYCKGRTEWLGEVSADLLLGAPSLAQSPLRVGAGIRHHLHQNWQGFAHVQVSASTRPSISPDAALVPLEPRAALILGLVYVHAPQKPASGQSPYPEAAAAAQAAADAKTAAAQATADEKTAEPDSPEQPAEAPGTPAGQLRGLIRSFSGRGLKATIRVSPANVQVETAEDGSFAVDVPPGAYEVAIEAEGFASQRREIRIEDNGVTILNADLRLRGGRR